MSLVYKYLFVLSILILGCENKSETSEPDPIDSLHSSFWSNEFKFRKYKVERANNGYGKKLFIDSLNYQIFRGYFIGDSTKLLYETHEDLLNDTVVYKEFYLNGNLKELSKATYYTRVPIKKHKFYNKKGGLIKEIDYEGQIKVKFDKAVEIAEREGMKKPFELNISKDSLYWKILIWKRIEFDSITNRGVDEAVGLSINRTSGSTKVIERQRKFVI